MSAINWLRVTGENGGFGEMHFSQPSDTLIGHVVFRALTKGHVTIVDTVLKMVYGVAAA